MVIDAELSRRFNAREIAGFDKGLDGFWKVSKSELMADVCEKGKRWRLKMERRMKGVTWAQTPHGKEREVHVREGEEEADERASPSVRGSGERGAREKWAELGFRPKNCLGF